MNRQIILLLIALAVALPRLVLAGPPRRPDLAQLQQAVTNLVVTDWHQDNPHDPLNPPHGIEKIEIHSVQRTDGLLTGTPVRLDLVKPIDETPVYLVDAVAHAKWWKQTTEHILVLKLTNVAFKPLLHASGGRNWKGVDFRIVDIGTTGSDFVLMVEDHGCGNQMSQTRTYLFRWNKEADEFDEVFNQLTSWLPSATAIVYESSVSFAESDSKLKDLVVSTTFIRLLPKYQRLEPLHESVFEWNGKQYVGTMTRPKDAPD